MSTEENASFLLNLFFNGLPSQRFVVIYRRKTGNLNEPNVVNQLFKIEILIETTSATRECKEEESK